MEYVDSHCHIQSIGIAGGEATTRQLWAKTDRTLNDVIKAATDAGVTRLIVVGCGYRDSQLACQTVRNNLRTWASIGIHPHEAKAHHDQPATLKAFGRLVTEPKVVAIGECGLDYYYEHSPKADQRQILEFQLGLALEHDLPLIFHVRDAYDDFWPIFDSFNSKQHPIRGVLHSFTDNLDNLKLAIDRGLMIGVNGIATFAKDPSQINIYKQIPLANLVLETDSPFLTPVPFRGTINEPKNVSLVAAFLAEIREESIKSLANQTTANAKSLFSIN